MIKEIEQCPSREGRHNKYPDQKCKACSKYVPVEEVILYKPRIRFLDWIVTIGVVASSIETFNLPYMFESPGEISNYLL